MICYTSGSWLQYAKTSILMGQHCAQALKITKHLQVEDFKASNGWLEKLKARHNIKRIAISGESGEVSSKQQILGKNTRDNI